VARKNTWLQEEKRVSLRGIKAADVSLRETVMYISHRFAGPMSACAAGILTFALLKEAVGLWTRPDLLSGWLLPLSAGLGSAYLCLYFLTRSEQGKAKSEGALGYGDTVLELTRSLELIVAPEQLQAAIMGRIGELFGATGVALFLKDPDGDRFVLRGQVGYEGLLPGEVAFEEKGRLAGWLRTNQTVLSVRRDREIVEYLSESERRVLEKLGVDFCLPFGAMNRLVGIALVKAGDMGLPEDLGFLRTLSLQVGLALENALLYEQQKLRLRRLYRAERLATVGQLATGVAHEVRNPLAIISSTVQYISQEFPPGHRKRKMAEELLEEVDRINRIVEGLLCFARPAEPKKERVSIRELLEQTILLVRTTAGKAGVEIETDFFPGDDRMDLDPAQMKQVFLNVAVNAIQAMPRGGKLKIKLYRIEEGLISGGHRFRVEFSDTGAGMSPEQLERAFDPFYTTKPDGTGLGLPISYSIVKSHGGEMDIESRPGEGTTVKIEL